MIELLSVILTIAIGWLALQVWCSSRGDFFHSALPFLLTYWFLYVLKFLGLKEVLLARFSEDLVVQGLLVAIAGIAAFSWGCRSDLSRRLARRFPPAPARWECGALFPYAVFLFTVAALGETLFIARSGGLEHFYSAARGAGDYQENTAYLYNLRWVCIPAANLVLVEIFFNRLPGAKKLIAVALVGVSIAYSFVIGQRSGLLAFGLTLAAVWFYAHRGRPRLWVRLALILLPFYLAIGVVGLSRSEFHLNSTFLNTSDLFRESPGTILQTTGQNFFYTGSDPDNNHQEPVLYLGVLHAVPDLVDYDYGQPYLNYLVHWIPRLWWPDKPNFRLEGVRRLENAMQTNLQGPVLTVLGYFHANLGLAAVIMGMFLTGVGLTSFYLWFGAQPGSLGALYIYLHLFYYGIGAAFSQGIFTGWDTILPFSLGPALGAFVYLRLTGRRFSALAGSRLAPRRRWPLEDRSILPSETQGGTP